jgi:hypothetical protein
MAILRNARRPVDAGGALRGSARRRRGHRHGSSDPGDIDVNVTDAAPAGHIFDDLLVTPVLQTRWVGWAAGSFGRAFEAAIIE